MKTKISVVRALRIAALFVLFAGLAVWARSGARLGWTQTSVVTMQRDEITGIDFPVRQNAFVAGVEVPFIATVVALGGAGLSLLIQRRTSPVKA